MTRRNRGASLAEVLIVVGIVTMLVAMLALGVAQCAGAGSEDVAPAARAFGQNLGLEVRGASCVDTDSDGDGYVSCTLSTADKGEIKLVAVECARRISLASGCRMQRPAGVTR